MLARDGFGRLVCWTHRLMGDGARAGDLNSGRLRRKYRPLGMRGEEMVWTGLRFDLRFLDGVVFIFPAERVEGALRRLLCWNLGYTD